MPKKTPGAGAKKPRWTAADKAAASKGPKKAHHRGQPDGPKSRTSNRPSSPTEPRVKKPRAERSPRWDDNDPRRQQRDDRPRRSFGERDDRPRRSFGERDDRPRRSFGERDDRPRRSFGERDDRPRREWQPREERSRDWQPRQDRDDRPRRSFGERDDRPRRSFGERDDRPRREWQPREERSRDWQPRQERDDRPRRSFGERDDRPRRQSRTPEHGYRVADPKRRDRHETRVTGADFDRPRSFDEAESERAEADTWTRYESKTKTGPVSVTEDNGFAALGLDERLVERLARDGITDPFPIQTATIPDALSGRDILGRGRTGSGKTLAFGLPTMTRLLTGERAGSKRPRALIMVPTRELAMQVSDALEPLVHVAGLRHKLVAGGLSYDPQIKALSKGIDILIATPGRLKDLLERGAVSLAAVEIAILDEADHMADMGFLPEVTAILDQVPAGGQRLLFSATLDNGIDTLVERYLIDPVTHSVDDAQASVTTMSHHLMLIDPRDKKQLTAQIANRPGRTVIFARTQLGSDRIAGELRERGVLAAALHGGLSQAVRNRVLGAFRDGKMPVLVATDVAARGIHVDDVGLVLQVDPPRDHKDYLHRAGRTARAGEEGAVVTFSLPHQRKMMERLLGQAGVETSGVKVLPDDEHVRATGGEAPSGVPVPDEQWRPILEGGPKRRSFRSGPPHRGSRPDGGRGRSGGRRPRAEWDRDR